MWRAGPLGGGRTTWWELSGRTRGLWAEEPTCGQSQESHQHFQEGSYVLPPLTPEGRVRCPNCGLFFGNESVIDCYKWCARCTTVLRAPERLWTVAPPPAPDDAAGLLLYVGAASWGHKFDPTKALDVTVKVRKWVTGHGAQDRLVISKDTDVVAWLGDPCPGERKTLRVRHAFLGGPCRGLTCEVWASEGAATPGHLDKDLCIQMPIFSPLVSIRAATYGSPAGAFKISEPSAQKRPSASEEDDDAQQPDCTTTPVTAQAHAEARDLFDVPELSRGAFDVTEFMRGRLLSTEEAGGGGGKLLRVGHEERLTEQMGDPCPGREKCLSVRYEVLGSEGRAEGAESGGRLVHPISVQATPILAPLVIILSATYGETARGIRERAAHVEGRLFAALEVMNRKEAGLPVTAAQNALCKCIDELIAESECLKGRKACHIDVTADLQRRVDELGGGMLELCADEEDLNSRFGNPTPGQAKQLRIDYVVSGHDSEHLTASEEVLPSGFGRTYMLPRKGTKVVQVKDGETGRGVMSEDVLVESSKVLPVLEVLNASYGHRTNHTKAYDVATEVRSIIDQQGGERLFISTTEDLDRLFQNPCRGVRKRLRVTYAARGFSGSLRVSESGGRLIADVLLGFCDRSKFKPSRLRAAALARRAPAAVLALEDSSNLRKPGQAGEKSGAGELDKDKMPALEEDPIAEAAAAAAARADRRQKRRELRALRELRRPTLVPASPAQAAGKGMPDALAVRLSAASEARRSVLEGTVGEESIGLLERYVLGRISPQEMLDELTLTLGRDAALEALRGVSRAPMPYSKSRALLRSLSRAKNSPARTMRAELPLKDVGQNKKV